MTNMTTKQSLQQLTKQYSDAVKILSKDIIKNCKDEARKGNDCIKIDIDIPKKNGLIDTPKQIMKSLKKYFAEEHDLNLSFYKSKIPNCYAEETWAIEIEWKESK